MKKLLLASGAALMLAGCGGGPTLAASEDQAAYVMVHSAWLGGWSWGPVAEVLEAENREVHAPDLPGHGQDQTPPGDVTLDSYVATITDLLDSLDGPAILVGHSLGGKVISQAAENRPDRVRALVYLCAFLLPDGASFMGATEGVQGSMVLDNLVMSDDGASVTIRPEVMHEAFAHDVPLTAFEAVLPLVVAQPTAPLGSPLAITDARWGSIPRYYIECTDDRAIPPGVQAAMYEAIPVTRVFSMHTSHAPIFAAPETVAAFLLEVN